MKKKQEQTEIQNTSYKDQLKDPKWLDKRNKILALAGHKCKHCDSRYHLQVHHLYYIKGKKAWQHPDKALIVLCEKCHIKWHRKYRLEYREEVWSKAEIYQPPENRKIYYVTKGKKAIIKHVPYTKAKVKHSSSRGIRALTPLEKKKKKLLKQKLNGENKYGFAPRSQKRLKELNLV